MARPRDKMTRSEKQWATINNWQAHYAERGPETERVRTARILANELAYTVKTFADPHGNYARLGLSDLHTDVMQRMEALQAAVKAAGEERE